MAPEMPLKFNLFFCVRDRIKKQRIFQKMSK